MHPYKSFKILIFAWPGWQLDGLTAKANRLPWPVRTEQAGSSRLAVPFRYVPCSKLPDGASGRFGSGADAPPGGDEGRKLETEKNELSHLPGSLLSN